MAKIDVEVFTNEIEKTYTILKQNLIMIDTIKKLIAQGNLSEEAIASLNTALSTTNTKLENLNTFTKQEFLRTNQKISTVKTTQENMNNVMPTDINVDTNKHLILEHNGVEITGQKKRIIPVIANSYDSASNTYEVNSIRLTGSLTISDYIYSYFYDIELDDGSGIYFQSRALEETVNVYLDTTKNANILTDQNLYVYTLKLSASFGVGMGYIYIDYQTSDNNNNVEVNSVTKFTTLTKATEGSIISCICSKESGDGATVIGNNIRYEHGTWYVYRNDNKYSYSYQGLVSNATITACSQLKKRTI